MDFLVTFLATLAGAAVALATDRWTRAREARLKEEAAVNNLILDLASKRALAVPEGYVLDSSEVDGVKLSVADARSLIRAARLNARPRSKYRRPLKSMTTACNQLLEAEEKASEMGIDSAWRLLVDELTSSVALMKTIGKRRIYNDAPGSGAL